MPETTLTSLTRVRLGTPAAKVAMVLILLLLMLIPLSMVAGLISERQQRQGETLADFQRGWGPDQTLAGPLLIVPYSWIETARQGGAASSPVRMVGYLRIPASHLVVQARLDPQTRRRGLYHAAIYTALVTLRGTVRIPDLAAAEPGFSLTQSVVDWQHGRLVFGASDLRGLPADSHVMWNGEAVPLDDSERGGDCRLTMFGATASLTEPKPGTQVPFETTLRLRGMEAFHVQPIGSDVDAGITSSWTTPSFIGASMPITETQGKDGFSAHWNVSGDAESANWKQRESALPSCDAPLDRAFFDADRTLGVALQEAVPTYLMVERAQKYGVLFLALSFLTLFLFEAVAKVRIHVVQYGLLGLSVSLFALLLISISEPLGFSSGYAISTLAVLIQASLYTLSVTRRVGLAAIFAGVLAALFGFLYVVLSLDAYALLAGTAALFTILSIVMVVTRRVDWNDAAGVA